MLTLSGEAAGTSQESEESTSSIGATKKGCLKGLLSVVGDEFWGVPLLKGEGCGRLWIKVSLPLGRITHMHHAGSVALNPQPSISKR